MLESGLPKRTSEYWLAEHGDWLAKRESLILGSKKRHRVRVAIGDWRDFSFEFVDDRPQADAVA